LSPSSRHRRDHRAPGPHRQTALGGGSPLSKRPPPQDAYGVLRHMESQSARYLQSTRRKRGSPCGVGRRKAPLPRVRPHPSTFRPRPYTSSIAMITTP
jgi:hypothetical protein